MVKISKIDMNEIREFCSLGCDYSDISATITELANETLEDLGINLNVDCMLIVDGDYEGELVLEEFIRAFYNKVSKVIFNVVETQES
mgnify:CR=1 FL=1